MATKIKICGITNIEDAWAAIDCGADLLGFNFVPESPRYLTLDDARKIVTQLPSFVDTVALFVNPDLQQVREATEDGLFNWIQLHGDEDSDFIRSIDWENVRTMKGLRVRDAQDFEKVDGYPVDAIILDAYDPDRYGGTGKTFDWNTMPQLLGRVFLAGGITPENAEAAVETGVYGIDICSGVEERPGKKDHAKLKKLFENIHHVRV